MVFLHSGENVNKIRDERQEGPVTEGRVSRSEYETRFCKDRETEFFLTERMIADRALDYVRARHLNHFQIWSVVQ